MIGKLSSVISRVLFLVAFLLAGLAVWEKLLNAFGFTVLRDYADDDHDGYQPALPFRAIRPRFEPVAVLELDVRFRV